MDVLAIVRVGRALDEHGILELVFKLSANQINADQMGEQMLAIFGTDYELSHEIMTAILSSNSIRTLMPAGINVILGYMEHFINENREENIIIDRINVDTIDWELETQYLSQIMYNLFAFVHSIDPFNLGNVDEFDLITSLELRRLGEVVNIIRDTQLFGEIYDSVIEAVLTMPEVVDVASPYVNLSELLTLLTRPSIDPLALDWVAEFYTIEQLLDLFVLISQNSTLNVEEIKEIIENLDSELLEFVIDGAIRAVFIEGFNENIGAYVDDEFVFAPEFDWLDKLSLKAISANADFFANMLTFVFNVAESGIENLTYEQLQILVDAVEGINTNENLTQQEIDDFKLFFDKLIQYMLGQINSELTWIQDIQIDGFIDNIDTIVELFSLAMSIQDGSIFDYTPAQIANLVAEIGELNNDLTPEMISVLQGFYDEFMAENSPLLVPINIASIDFLVEGQVIGDLLSLYIDYENTQEFNTVLATNLVQSLQNSYIANQVLTAVIQEVVQEEELPEWISSVDMTWVADNEGLVVVLLEVALWSQDNSIENLTQTQIDAIQAEIDNIPDTPQYEEFKDFMQSFLNDITVQ